MGERVIRRRTVGQRDLVHETGDVVAIVGKTPHMAFQRIADETPGAPLTAPVKHGDGEAAAPQLANHLEIFLDELGAAREDARSRAGSGSSVL
jgi:hypothetical protein